MIAHVNEFASQQRQALAEQVHRFREEPIASLREVAATSAGDLKSFKAPVRAFAHSGVKFATVSQRAIQNLIELESEIITSALTAAAVRLERAAKAENIVDLVLDQAEMLGATRDRFVNEATRAVAIFKVAGRDMRKVGAHLYGQVFETAEEELAKAKTTRARSAKRVVRKGRRAVSQAGARARKVAV
jgi:hypothetical protein